MCLIVCIHVCLYVFVYVCTVYTCVCMFVCVCKDTAYICNEENVTFVLVYTLHVGKGHQHCKHYDLHFKNVSL